MNYVSELLEDYPPTMSARLLAFLLTAGSGRPEEEYRCLKKYPQLTMRTHVRALAAIVEHASKTGDEQGAFALGVKLCNLRAAAKWGIEHYQRRIQGEGIDVVYRGVPLPGGATNLASVMKQFEREQRRDELERRHAHLAKVYPTLYAGEGDEQEGRQVADTDEREGRDSDAAGVRGTRNLFRKEFGHLTQAAQDKFKEDSLWMGQAENVLRGDEANKLRAQMRRGLSKGLNVKLVHRKPTFQEALVRQQKAESKAQEEEELFKKRLQKKKAAVPITSGQQRRGSDPAPAAAGRTGRRPSNAMDQHTSTASPDATSTDEVDVHYYHGLEANTQGKHEEAIRHYTAALALDKWRPEIWTSRGMAYYCVGEYESAVRDFTRCIRIEPSNPTPLFFRGRCFHKSGDLKAALVDFDDATEKDPDNVDYMVSRAQLLLEMDQPRSALDAFTKARETYPHDPQIAIQCAQAHTSLKEFEQAERLASAALELLSSTDSSARESADERAEREDDNLQVAADSDVEPEPESEPEPEPEPEPEETSLPEPEPELSAGVRKVMAETLCLRGNARTELGRHGDAAKDYYAAVNYDPECALAHHCIGSMLVAEGHNLSEAIRELHLAVELNPQMMVAHLQLAAVHTQLEEHDMAAACLTTCIEQAGDDPRRLCVIAPLFLFYIVSILYSSVFDLLAVFSAVLWHTASAGLLILAQTLRSCVRRSLITQLLYGMILGWTQRGAVVALLTGCLVEHNVRLETMLERPN